MVKWSSGVPALVDVPAPARGVPTAVRDDIGTRSGAIRTLFERVRAEYGEMPGLGVTLPQAQRLWAVDRSTCEEAFSRLISTGVLRRTTKGRFVRA